MTMAGTTKKVAMAHARPSTQRAMTPPSLRRSAITCSTRPTPIARLVHRNNSGRQARARRKPSATVASRPAMRSCAVAITMALAKLET
jgi:hypothetical protein